jgi:pimeloyl-ACP methyl ester carboxylesterase
MLPLVGLAAPALDIPATRDAWEPRRQQFLKQWQQIIGPLPERPPVDVKVVSTEELPDHTRLLLHYADNDAYLLLPKKPGKHPGMIVLHPTSDQHIRGPVGLANRETNHHALHLVRRGYVCIAPRNFLWRVEGRKWQDSAAGLLQQGVFKTGMARMLHEAMQAVDVLAARPEVDPTRIGAIGHSLGGKEALYLAAFDERIRAAISSEGGVGLTFSNWEADWYLGQQIREPGFHHDNHEIIALIAPRALMVVGGESADGAQSQPYIDACLPLWRLYGAEHRLQLLRHNQGHSFPKPGPEREKAYEWLDRWIMP